MWRSQAGAPKEGQREASPLPAAEPRQGREEARFPTTPCGLLALRSDIDSVPPGKKEGGGSPACKKGPFTHPQLEDTWLSSSKSCLLGGQGPQAA